MWRVTVCCAFRPSNSFLLLPSSQVNNAGIFIDCCTVSCDGLDTMWVTNCLSHYLLTSMLLPALQAAAPSRIVHVSSEAAWISPLDIHLLPPTPFFSKVGGNNALLLICPTLPTLSFRCCSLQRSKFEH